MKLLTPFLAFLMLFTFAVSVSAQTPTVSLLQRNARTQVVQPNTKTGGTVQTRSIAEIDRRIAALNLSVTNLNQIKFLAATEKTALAQKIQTELSSLAALKQKITANTDPAMLKNDIASVSATHRTFAFVFPQVRILAAADALNTVANLLFDFAEKLEVRIGEAKAAGENVARLETQLASMKSQITSAQTITTSIMSTATSTAPDAANGKTVLTSAARSIKQAASSLRSAYQTGNQIREALAELNSAAPTTPSSSESASPTVPNAY